MCMTKWLLYRLTNKYLYICNYEYVVDHKRSDCKVFNLQDVTDDFKFKAQSNPELQNQKANKSSQ